MAHISNDFGLGKKIRANESGAVEDNDLPPPSGDASTRAVVRHWWWSAADTSRPVYGPYEI